MKEEFPDEASLTRHQRRIWNMMQDNLRLSSRTVFVWPRHHGKSHFKKIWEDKQHDHMADSFRYSMEVWKYLEEYNALPWYKKLFTAHFWRKIRAALTKLTPSI